MKSLKFTPPPANRRFPILASKQRTFIDVDGKSYVKTIYKRFTNEAWRSIANTIERGGKRVIKSGWTQIADVSIPKAAMEAMTGTAPAPAPTPTPKPDADNLDSVVSRILAGDFDDIDVEVLRNVVRVNKLQIAGYSNTGAKKLAPKVKAKLEKKFSENDKK